MAQPGDLSSKKIKNTYTGIVQHDGGTSKLYDGTGSRVVSIDVTRITASKASIINITDLAHLTASKVQVDTHLSVSGSTVLGDDCGSDTVTIVGNTWLSGSLTVSGSCEGSFRSVGQAKFIYLDNPVIEDQKPARVTRGEGYGQFNVPRFGGENAALDVYGNVVITGSLIVQDTVWAQEFHTEVVSQSIVYTSGSTKFGGDSDDIMTITGSVFQSGSAAYFLNGMGIGTTGSIKPGTYAEPGQDAPVEFTHLLRIDDPGHDGLQHKNNKLIYGSFGSSEAAHVSASDVVRFRDREQSDDVFVISSISQSVFFSTNDKYNVGIGVPSGSTVKIDENLVVSSSTNARVKIESATGATSASLYLESGQSKWEIATVSKSVNTGNQISGSLVFRTQGNVSSKDNWSGNTTYNEALRLDKNAKAGFNIPSVNAYQYPQQVQISGSINIIQGRTRNINAGTFHDKDGINGIYFNNQKMIYVSGSGASTSMFFGVSAGGQDAATGGEANIAIGYQTAFALTTGDFNTLIGLNAGKLLVGGSANVFMGSSAGAKTTDGVSNVGIGTNALRNSTGGGQYNIAIGDNSIGAGDTSGNDNIAIGRLSLEDTTTGFNNVSIGHQSLRNLTTADKNIAIGSAALGLGIVTGNDNIAVGSSAGQDMTSGADNILLGNLAGTNLTDNVFNIAIGHDSLATSANDGDKNIAIGFESMKTGDVSGAENIGIGSLSLEDLTTGTDNVAVGSSAALNLTTAANTIAIGHDAMGLGVVVGNNNIAVGELSGHDLTAGADNIFVGTKAGGNATNNTFNIAIGHDAFNGSINDGNKNIAVGYESMKSGDVSGLSNIALGSHTLDNLTTGGTNIAVGSGSMGLGTVTSNDNIAIGNFALEDITSGGNNIAIGSGSLASATDNTGNIALGFEALKTSANDGDRNIAIGYQTIKTGDVSGADNIAIGTNALDDLTSGTDNIVLGAGAGLQVTNNANNVVIGHDAFAASINDGDKNVAIGTGAMKTGDVSGDGNIAVGELTLEDLTTGTDNIAIGSGAGLQVTDNVDNIAIGHDAFAASVNDGDKNIAIGSGAMKTGDVSGANNIAIGELSLDDITTGTNNVAIGSSAGLNLTEAANTIAIGHDAMGAGVTTGTNNIAIGELALKSVIGATYNIAIGKEALRDTTNTAARNIAIGEQAAFAGVVTGADNIIMGTNAAQVATSLAENIIIGHKAVETGVMTGDHNTIVGPRAAENITSGADNVIIGTNAGSKTLTINTNNILIGSRPSASSGIDNAYAIGNRALVTQANSMVLGGQTGERFSIGMGGITAPNATLEVSGTMNITGSFTTSGSAHTIKGDLFVGEEVATTAWTMAHYGDTDTKWVVDDDEMIFTVGNEQMLKMTEDGSQDIVTIADGGDIDFRVSAGATNALFVQGSTARVGIGTAEPGEKLEVIGDISASGDIHGDKFISNNKHVADYNGSRLLIGNSTTVPILIGRQGVTQIDLSGPVTASGTISASGAIFTETIHTSQGASTNNTLNINPNSNGPSFAGNSHTLQVYGSVKAGINSNTAHDLDGILSTTNYVSASGFRASGNITASGNLGITGNALFGEDVAIAAALAVEGVTTLNGNVTIGNAITDLTSINSHVTMSAGVNLSGSLGGVIVAGSYYIGGSSAHPGNRRFVTPSINDAKGIDLGNSGDGNLLLTHLTASGNVSASGNVYADDYFVNGVSSLDNTNTQLRLGYNNTHTRISLGRHLTTTQVNIEGNVTASGNISSSGTVLSGKLRSLNGSSINTIVGSTIIGSGLTIPPPSNKLRVAGASTFDSHITSSGNISSSGTIIANTFVGKTPNIQSDTDITYTADIDGNEVGQHIFRDRTTVLATIDQTGADFISHITASGNISSSGYFEGNHYVARTEILTAAGNAVGNSPTATGVGTVFAAEADGTKAVNLPAVSGLVIGHTITLHNTDPSAVLKVFPATGDRIFPLADNAVATLPASTAMVVTVGSADGWTGYFTTAIA